MPLCNMYHVRMLEWLYRIRAHSGTSLVASQPRELIGLNKSSYNLSIHCYLTSCIKYGGYVGTLILVTMLHIVPYSPALLFLFLFFAKSVLLRTYIVGC